MKKFLKFLAGAAALAAVIPYKVETDEKGGTIKGLLYKVDWTIDPDYQSEPEVNVNFGFNNPFEDVKESHLFADELVVDYCCDETLTHTPVSETQADPAEEEAPVDGDCNCGGDCDCDCGGDNCDCEG